MDLNEGVVDGNNVDTTVVDAVEQLEWEVVPRVMWGRGALTHCGRPAVAVSSLNITMYRWRIEERNLQCGRYGRIR